MWQTLILTVLKLLGVLFIGVNVLMKGKPIIAFVLFVKDWIKMDKSAFRGYGFWLFCGLGGSGKTLSMVEYLIRMKRAYPRLKVYTNFNFKLADGYINSWQDIINIENYHLKEISLEEFSKLDKYNRLEKDGKYYEKVHDGVIFGFDEIHLTFASQNWGDCPDNMLEYISQQRKLHKQIVASSQVFTRIDKKLREQTNFVVECKSIFMGRLVFNKFFNTCEYLAAGDKKDSGMRRRRRAKHYSFVAYDSIRDKYDTMQVMKELKTSDTTNTSKFIDELVEKLKSK